MKTHSHGDILIGLKKAQTLMDKIIHMIEDKQYCIDIMQQNLAAIGLLKSAHAKLFENHLNTCFKAAMASSSTSTKQKMIEEILKVTKISTK